MISLDLNHYGLYLQSVKTERYENAPATVGVETTLIIKSTAMPSELTRIEQFASDMAVMNQVRASLDPAVKEAYEQMLTVMALTKGRDLNDGGI